VIKYKHTNLLDSQAEALVNTVNLVGIMGKGIALQFKEMFPLNFKLYQKACKEGVTEIGKVFVTETMLITGPKYVINFPTKTDWRAYTRIEYIEHGLDDLVKVIDELQIKSVAVPPLGCGNGGLDWQIVKPLMEKKLQKLSDKIQVEVYEPGHHSYVQTNIRKKVSDLTKPRALVLALAEMYNVLGFDISHLEIQKLSYFLQELGQPELKLRFEKGHYGPYALNLKYLLVHLEGTYFKGQIRFQDMKPTDSLKLISERLHEVHAYLKATLSSEERDQLRKVNALIEGFESPYGMELLATVHWAKKDLPMKSSIKEITNYIHSWSQRKKDFMKEDQIQIALKRIDQFFT
jgi:O-acetyl-ADP-ribose deacetylase (regulator of RNase III)